MLAVFLFAVTHISRILADKSFLRNTLILYKRKIIDTMGKTPEQTAIIEETYSNMENELISRIEVLNCQGKHIIRFIGNNSDESGQNYEMKFWIRRTPN